MHIFQEIRGVVAVLWVCGLVYWLAGAGCLWSAVLTTLALIGAAFTFAAAFGPLVLRLQRGTPSRPLDF